MPRPLKEQATRRPINNPRASASARWMNMFDHAVFSTITANDPDVAREIAELFRQDSGELLEQLAAAVAAGDDSEARRLGHTLKSSAGSVGGLEASRLAALIEHGGLPVARESQALLRKAVAEAVTAMQSAIRTS